jgi:hypothetical protein
MGAPVGNQNAAKAKLWNAAIQRAIERLGSGKELDPNDDRSDFVKGLDRMADEFVKRQDDGLPFFKELGDRLDGKPAQAITGADGGPLQVEKITFEIVKP